MRLSAPIIGVVVAILLTALFWFLLYQPRAQEQAELEAETAALEQQQASLRAQIADLRSIEENQVEIRASLTRLEEYIPPAVGQPRAIRQFQSTADHAGVDITALTFAEPTSPGTAEGAVGPDTGDPGRVLATIATTMTVEGGYFQIVDFFRRLEVDVPRAVLIQNVDLLEATPEQFPTLSATWTGQLFAVLPVDDLVDIEAPAGGAPAPTPAPTDGATPAPTEAAP